jgi:hypothetical protein
MCSLRHLDLRRVPRCRLAMQAGVNFVMIAKARGNLGGGSEATAAIELTRSKDGASAVDGKPGALHPERVYEEKERGRVYVEEGGSGRSYTLGWDGGSGERGIRW